MSRLLQRYLLGVYLRSVVAIFVTVLAVFLIADLGDRARVMFSHAWQDVLLLYWNKTLVTAQQLGPAALLLAAGTTISTLRKNGELTAMRSLTFSPAALYVPLGLCALLLAVGLMVFDEFVATRAGDRVDEISYSRFKSWADRRFYYRPVQWFRRGDRVFYFREGDAEKGFRDVTLLTLRPDFTLASRLDAETMGYAGDGRWTLGAVTERAFDGDKSSLETRPFQVLELNAPIRAFNVRAGRPQQMRLPVLREQIRIRTEGGLPVAQHRLALHNRFAYPLTGFAAAMLAIGLALRPGRRGHLTVALMEGLAVAVGLWGMMVVGRALVLGEHLSAPIAAWTPVAVLLGAAGVLWLRREGKLGRSGI